MKTHNVTVGVFTDRNDWSRLFGGMLGCPEVSDAELLWEPVNAEDDGQFNFNSYHQIGGWKAPTIKQASDLRICGALCDLDYYP